MGEHTQFIIIKFELDEKYGNILVSGRAFDARYGFTYTFLSPLNSYGPQIFILKGMDGWMNGVLGHFYAQSRLNWAGDNLGFILKGTIMCIVWYSCSNTQCTIGNSFIIMVQNASQPI